MNLKDAFRYQNILSSWIDQISGYLAYPSNVMCITQEHLRSETNPKATNETINRNKDRTYQYEVNRLIDFLISLLDEKECLTDAINLSKHKLPIDMDSAIALNKKRQYIRDILNRLSNMKSFEATSSATAYTFNNEGNQTAYTYDVKEITVIDFDRKKTKALSRALSDRCDKVSNQLDKVIIETIVDFKPIYDINDEFDEALEYYMTAK